MSTLAARRTTLRKDATVIGLVGLAHLISHYSQLLLAPLFPWLKQEFAASYTELGMLLTIFFVVSCIVQAASGFIVDRFGPRPVLFGGLFLLGVAALGYAASRSYWALALFSAVAGVGNGVFHPVDFTLLNRKVDKQRLGHAYSVHGITGSLGWALAPAMLVPLAIAFSWRTALVCAAALAFGVLLLLWLNRAQLTVELAAAPTSAPQVAKGGAGLADAPEGAFDFLKIPAVWMCLAFFFLFAVSLSVVQSFAPQAASQLHAVPPGWVAMCLTIYMVCGAGGTLFGGFLAADPSRCERIVAAGFSIAAVIALTVGFADLPALAVPALFGAMGAAAGIAGPSRDLIVKRSAPDNATGRVYGVVYSGLDIGQAAAPLVFGWLMDHQRHQAVWVGLALVQAVLVASAFNVRRVRRAALAPAHA